MPLAGRRARQVRWDGVPVQSVAMCDWHARIAGRGAAALARPQRRSIAIGLTHGAGRSEELALRWREVFVIGVDNSAGQAAIHLARHAALVTILALSDTLAASMSDSL